MENNNTIKEFFEFINKECLFYCITIHDNGHVDVKWENIEPHDYVVSPEVANRINLRVQKTRQQKRIPYFLDCFQYYQKTTHWKGLQMDYCSHYEIHQNKETNNIDDWFDAVFYFSNKEKLTIHHINTKSFLVLQDFFHGFM